MTTPLPPDPTHDDDLPGEAELKALYGRLPTAEPSPALDATIRQAAARAALGSERPAQARRRRHWPIALGTAATVVLAAGLAWRMREMPARETSSPSAPAAAMDAARNAGARMPAGAGPASPPPHGTPAMKSVASEPSMTTNQARPAAPAHPVAARRAPAPVAASRMPERMAPEPTLPAAPMPQRQTRASEADVLEAAPMPAPAAPMAPAPPAPPSAPPIFAPTFAPAPGAATIGTQFTPSPGMELDAIRVLYAKGETVEADKRLQAFHDSHPDWPLPDDLRRHLDRIP